MRANRGVRSGEAVRHLMQTRPHNCGQTCLAMLAGLPVSEVERDLGKTGKTRTKDLVGWLRRRGWACPDRLVRFRSLLPPLAVVKLVWKTAQGRPRGHWVVVCRGRWLDPSAAPGTLSGGRLTGFLPLTK